MAFEGSDIRVDDLFLVPRKRGDLDTQFPGKTRREPINLAPNQHRVHSCPPLQPPHFGLLVVGCLSVGCVHGMGTIVPYMFTTP